MSFELRKYREYTNAEGLVKFEVIEGETDLLIMADKYLNDSAQLSIAKYRGDISKYISEHPEFQEAYSPLNVPFFSKQIIKNMAWAAKRAKVGPMAAVAGAMAELVGKELLKFTNEIIIENGGDIFLKINKTRKVGIFSGSSPFSEKIALEIDPKDTPCGVCTSSGTIGPSFSFGKADAVCVIAKSAALADAAASAIGNVVESIETIDKGIEIAKKIRGLMGVLIIKDDRMGVLGRIKIVPS
ncbi:MAG: hypothetical protein FD145_402 [Candidatus Saganbacteria bacterium]|uniref:Uncharacterized protein n=1 Tax=Candidatus Saganbacteria bacterium TaxID=2575572 RepID=A0A833L1Z6_UNCSA|nr:MAG: hypothetical protein FD145_402 [Candidatus Saganbacteria bacterium]